MDSVSLGHLAHTSAPVVTGGEGRRLSTRAVQARCPGRRRGHGRPCAGASPPRASWEPYGQFFSGTHALHQPQKHPGVLSGACITGCRMCWEPPGTLFPITPSPAALPSLCFPRSVSWRVTYFVPTPRASEERDLGLLRSLLNPQHI